MARAVITSTTVDVSADFSMTISVFHVPGTTVLPERSEG
jgi:hypothetical protein